MALTAKNRLLSMIVNRSEKFDVTSSNSIASVRGTAHFRPATFGISDSRPTISKEMFELVQKVL